VCSFPFPPSCTIPCAVPEGVTTRNPGPLEQLSLSARTLRFYYLDMSFLSASRGFSLLEVLVAFAIASLALGWFLYFLSEIHQTQSRARQKLLSLDQSWGQVLLQQGHLSPEGTFIEKKEDELRLKEVPDEKISGFFFVELKKEGIWWKFFYFSPSKGLPPFTPSSPTENKGPTLPFKAPKKESPSKNPLPFSLPSQ